MKTSTLWSLRLGFSDIQSNSIEQFGIDTFLQKSFSAPYNTTIPTCLINEPKTINDLQELRKKLKNSNSEIAKNILKEQILTGFELRKWWVTEIHKQEFPLREKMVLFWHNHFVATMQKVKVNWWIYQHNAIIRENAFGNFKTITKLILKTNAMVKYLDNVDNRKGNVNENLSRELLELFTLGIGNYNEEDIKNGAKALAGLGLGENEAKYRKPFEINETITYLGKTGNFKVDDLVDIIFEQPNTPYFLTKKILQWFIYDKPSEELVKYYGDFFRKVDFEIQPLLTKIITEEYAKKIAGSKIKNPLEYILQLHNALQIKDFDALLIVLFLRQQGMDLFNQPNVKGWEGGNSWLTSQLYLHRNNLADLWCNGRTVKRNVFDTILEENKEPKISTERIEVSVKFNKNETQKQILSRLSDTYLFQVDDNLQKDLESILKYDFDANATNAQQTINRLFNFISKTPEFQII